MLACLFRADARGLREAEEAAPSQATRHPSVVVQFEKGDSDKVLYHYPSVVSLSYRMPSRLYCGRVILVRIIVLSFESIQSEGITTR
jgi:hypothetical protein